MRWNIPKLAECKNRQKESWEKGDGNSLIKKKFKNFKKGEKSQCKSCR